MINRLNFVAAAAFAVIAAGCGNDVKPEIPRDAEIERRVEKTLSRMGLDEKIGQMAQITIDAASEKSADGNSYTLKEEKLAEYIDKYKVGSFLNTPISKAMPAAEWNKLVKTLNDRSLKAMGIPTLFGLDHIHGTTYISDGTLFPQPLRPHLIGRSRAELAKSPPMNPVQPMSRGRSTRLLTLAVTPVGRGSGKTTERTGM